MSKARDLSNFISDATVDATEIADLAVTHAKLHTDMNLSSKTLTFAANQISGNAIDGGVISNFASTGIDDNASSTAVTILSGGNVGIGTTTPSEKLEVAGTAKAEQYLLDAVAKDISDTAVDVFVYDTRKDSDGGAWRKRTQHTSWYNETLNTATRGSRKEFPAVAVIVAESNQVTIYDGDDPDLPMWMVFNGADNQNILVNATYYNLAAINGVLCVGTLGITINFISEFVRGHRSRCTARVDRVSARVFQCSSSRSFTNFWLARPGCGVHRYLPDRHRGRCAYLFSPRYCTYHR